MFRNLGEEGTFSDVILVSSDDQKQIPAHKVVLSACSPVLKSLLVNNPHSHPLVYLRRIKQTELQAILKFMYFGETQILENRIEEFMSVANDLQVKDICQEQAKQSESTEKPEYFEERELEPEINKNKIANIESTLIDEDLRTFINEDMRKVVNNDKEGKKYICDKCEERFMYSWHLKSHKQSEHMFERFICNQCNSSFNQTWALTRHMLSRHAKQVQMTSEL